MYKILTKASINQITGFQVCKYMGQFANLPQSTCPNRSNIKYLLQTHQCANGMCYKRGFLQLVCVHLCCWREIHFEDCMLPPGLISCSCKITAVLRKKQLIFLLLQGFTKCHVYSTAHTTIRYWKSTCIYRVFLV